MKAFLQTQVEMVLNSECSEIKMIYCVQNFEKQETSVFFYESLKRFLKNETFQEAFKG